MQQILISCREAMVAAIPLVPIYWALNRNYIHNTKRCIAYLMFSIYLATMYAAVGLPDITYYRFHPHFNWIPFQYMFTAWETTLLNVVLFVPLGFFMFVLWKAFHSPVKTVFLGFLVSSVIELLQIFTYRATDINDLMTNTFGTFLGYLLGMLTLKIFPAIHPTEEKKDILVIYSISFGVMFFIYPFLNSILQ